MATILLNGVETDASSISGSDLNDKLTVSGGVDGLSVDLADGDDAVEIFADSEDVTDTEIRVSEGDDLITVIGAEEAGADFVGMPISLGDSLLGGPGDDVIRLEDGLVQLTGAVKGNEDDDTIHVANINGGTVNGNAGDDTLRIGDAGVFALTDLADAAGERGDSALTNGSVMGGQGNDTIDVDADVTGSAIRGNEGDDTITVEGEFSGATTLNGNAGDDIIDASAAEGDVTVIGGSGDDTLTVGNGQIVRGGQGADTFIVASEGGATIEDYDQLDDADCFCDDQIQVDGWQFDVAAYNVTTDLNTSASSWTGDIKVKAVALPDGDGATAVAKLTKTKTETITAFAVAKAFILDTEIQANTAAAAKFLAANSDTYAVTYPRVGSYNPAVKVGTYQNGMFSNGFDPGNGIGQGFASAEGIWYSRAVGASNAVIKGLISAPTAQTSTAFEKGDFSFLQLTNTAKVGVAVGQQLLFNDVTNATVKNHWAEYVKEKSTITSKTLYQINFGTAAFSTITTGKAYQVITKGLDTAKVYDTKTITDTEAQATATARLDLDDEFFAWKRVATTVASGSQKTADGNFSWVQLTGATPAGSARYNVGGALQLIGTGDVVVTNKIVNTYTTDTVFKTTATTGKFILAGGTRGTGTLLSANQMLYATLTSRGLATLTTTAKYANLVRGGYLQVTKTVGVNNTNVTDNDYVTATGRLVMKIQASDLATATAGVALDTIVKRMTVTGTEIPITTCPEFPTIGTLATNIVDGFAKHGDVTGTFNTGRVFTSAPVKGVINNIGRTLSATFTGDLLSGALNGAAAAVFGNGFFSASAFTVDALAKEGFGSAAVAQASSDAQGVPFRVLFFDNDATDNGLYAVSGLANYNDGELTGLRTDAGTVGGSTMAGKHTIVKVSGGKGSLIELSDISFI